MPKITEEHINEAIRMSRKSPVNKKFGAVMIYNGKIVSKGYNYYNKAISDNTKCCLLRV